MLSCKTISIPYWYCPPSKALSEPSEAEKYLIPAAMLENPGSSEMDAPTFDVSEDTGALIRSRRFGPRKTSAIIYDLSQL